MKLKSSQRGLSGLGLLVVLILIGFFATAAVKLLPIYIESWSVKGVLNSVVEESATGSSVAEIKKKLDRHFTVNQINAIALSDIKFSKKKGGKIVIDATYEQRVNFMQNIDVVVKFDKFIYEVQAK